MFTKRRPFLPTLILFGFLVRLFLAWATGLGVDESYMVAAGRELHLGYFDHPPLSWWLCRGAALLFGSEAPVVVRLPFIVLFAGSTWLMARLTAAVAAPRAGEWAALAFSLSPVFGLTSATWVLPDGPLICALLAAGLCLVHAVRGDGGGWWVGAGAAAGLALLSKYSAILPMAGAVVGIATHPAYRRWLRRPEPYGAALVALAIFSPVIVWNAGHGWASLAFQGGRAAAARFQPFGPVVTLAGEAVFLLPWIWAGLMLALWRGLWAGREAPAVWLMCWLAIPPIVLFALLALWSRNVLFHWAAPGYLFLFPLLGAWLAAWVPARRWARFTAGLTAGVLVLVLAEIRFNWLAAFRPGFDPALQAVDLVAMGPALAARGLREGPIAALSWSDTGKIDYALGGSPRVLCLNRDCRQYGLNAAQPRAGETILLIAPRQTAERVHAGYDALFDHLETLAPLAVAVPGRAPLSVPMFRGYGLTPGLAVGQ